MDKRVARFVALVIGITAQCSPVGGGAKRGGTRRGDDGGGEELAARPLSGVKFVKRVRAHVRKGVDCYLAALSGFAFKLER